MSEQQKTLSVKEALEVLVASEHKERQLRKEKDDPRFSFDFKDRPRVTVTGKLVWIGDEREFTWKGKSRKSRDIRIADLTDDQAKLLISLGKGYLDKFTKDDIGSTVTLSGVGSWQEYQGDMTFKVTVMETSNGGGGGGRPPYDSRGQTVGMLTKGAIDFKLHNPDWTSKQIEDALLEVQSGL